MRFKVAIQLSGHMRSWSRVRDSFIKFLSDVDYDLYVHTYTNVKHYHPYIIGHHGIENDDVMASEEEIIKMIDLPIAKIVVEDEARGLEEVKQVEVVSTSNYQYPKLSQYNDEQVLKGKGIKMRTYYQYRKFRLCNEMRQASGIKYDFVLKLRPDTYYGAINTTLGQILNRISGRDISNIVWTWPYCMPPSDHTYIGKPQVIDRLVESLKTIAMPLDREYNAHEYAAAAIAKAGLTFIPTIELTHCQPWRE
jgi:hypothetical protein